MILFIIAAAVFGIVLWTFAMLYDGEVYRERR